MAADFELQRVKVRMYRPGLGDCFLLTFQSSSTECRYMLIDCGVLQNTKGQEERLRQIIADIKAQCGGSLHIVVATHEHADHVSGFDLHSQIFQSEFQIGEVWLPWTEDKQDPRVADAYSAVRNTPAEALKRAMEKYDGMPEDEIPASVRNIQKVFDFISDKGMDSVKSLVEEPHYLRPDANTPDGPTKVIVRPDFGGARFHVLGPPEDPAALGHGNLPQAKNQIYAGEPLNSATAFAAALLKRNPSAPRAAGGTADLDIQDLFEMCLPFDETCQLPMAEARKRKFFIEHYGFDGEDGAGGASWRRIDDDWMEAGTQLALALDSHTNNTSLVLAIELSPGGKVLLFPGDAQHGSWLSWATTARGKDLLQRTVFYKVGHHGSNNATLITGGLDQMTSPHLVAMLPVDPVRQPNFHLPDTKRLLPRLSQQARGRVIQSCAGGEADETCPCVDFRLPADKPADLSAAEWKDFVDSICWDPSANRLWVEYSLPV